eukprot:359944-Chlamydomonas_euryale.AAC.10
MQPRPPSPSTHTHECCLITSPPAGAAPVCAHLQRRLASGSREDRWQASHHRRARLVHATRVPGRDDERYNQGRSQSLNKDVERYKNREGGNREKRERAPFQPFIFIILFKGTIACRSMHSTFCHTFPRQEELQKQCDDSAGPPLLVEPSSGCVWQG